MSHLELWLLYAAIGVAYCIPQYDKVMDKATEIQPKWAGVTAVAISFTIVAATWPFTALSVVAAIVWAWMRRP